jgi:hypothetical protein
VRNWRRREEHVVLVLLMMEMFVMIAQLQFRYSNTSRGRVMFDRNNPVMEPGSFYPNMKEFRLAMRQYAIDKEFKLGVEATDRMRYRGCCWGRRLSMEYQYKVGA